MLARPRCCPSGGGCPCPRWGCGVVGSGPGPLLGRVSGVVAHGWNVDWLAGAAVRGVSTPWSSGWGLESVGVVGPAGARCWVLRERAPIRVVGVVALWVAAAVNRLVRVLVRVSFGSSGGVWCGVGAGFSVAGFRS